MTDSFKLFKLHSEFRHDIDNDEFVSSWNDVLLLSASVQGTFFYYNLSQSARLPRFYLTICSKNRLYIMECYWEQLYRNGLISIR